jgi:putative membrane protein insertion efficiency factor
MCKDCTSEKPVRVDPLTASTDAGNPKISNGKQTSRNWSGPYQKTPGRLLGMGLIRFYQLTLSGFIGNSCRHIPTCSEYGYEAVARHGLWPGFWMALFRFARCGPGGTSGLDPVPETLPERNTWYRVWRYFRIR